ncbi:MAG TPA: PIG-L deacetylase family protein [Thermomicrobiales bacterium]|nr:PIG-L deacetylase family protein [Thermomicrobiales bacterium]
MTDTRVERRPLPDDLLSLPLRTGDSVRDFGPTLVVAPHADDESLGCGGAIALLAQSGVPVRVLFVTDGVGSHPGSRRYPPDRLRALRETEARDALAELGVAAHNAAFLRLPDRRAPRIGSAGFARAAGLMREHMRQDSFTPRTIILPWRRDPHTDHRAAWELVTAALCASVDRPRLLEYPIWVWELGTDDDLPEPGEAFAWRLDISAVLQRKLRAIAAHRSQTTPLIDDDPVGWYLKPHTLARFSQPWEVYLEPQD